MYWSTCESTKTKTVYLLKQECLRRYVLYKRVKHKFRHTLRLCGNRIPLYGFSVTSEPVLSPVFHIAAFFQRNGKHRKILILLMDVKPNYCINFKLVFWMFKVWNAVVQFADSYIVTRGHACLAHSLNRSGSAIFGLRAQIHVSFHS